MNQAILVIAAFVRNVILRRALAAIDPEPALNFWRVIYWNVTDLFGSDKEPVHWKRVVPKSEHADFRRDLLAFLGVSREGWRAYRDDLKSYRDKFAAHHDPFHRDVPLSFPDFDLGLRATDFLLQLDTDQTEHGAPLPARFG